MSAPKKTRKGQRAAPQARASRGAGLVEYGRLTGLVAVVVIGAVSDASLKRMSHCDV